MFLPRVALGILLTIEAPFAQQYVISTIAGGTLPQGPFPAVSLSIGTPYRVTTDSVGNLYFSALNAVWKLDRVGQLTRIAGTLIYGFSGDGGPATGAQLADPWTPLMDAAGNLWIADRQNNRVRKVSPNGIITTIAGSGATGFGRGSFSGDGGPATTATLAEPVGLCLDSANNLYIADTSNNRVRRVSADGTITTFAGNGAASYSGDGEQAQTAGLNYVTDVASDNAGNIYIADLGNSRVRKVLPNGVITTLVQLSGRNGSGQGGGETAAIALDPGGNLYVASGATFAAVVQRISPDGSVTIVAGGGANFGDDGIQATSAGLYQAWGVALDAAGNVFIPDYTRIRRVSPAGIITTVAGNGNFSRSGDGGPAQNAQLSGPRGLTADSAGNLYVAEPFDNCDVRKISVTGIITTVAGNGSCVHSGDGGSALSAGLSSPTSVAVDSARNLYIAEGGAIRKVSPSGIISTFAGTGSGGFSGDGGPATSALLSASGVAVDGGGNVYIADPGNSRVRKVSTSGIITTVAGNGTKGYSGDGGPALAAQLNTPSAVAVDARGSLYIGDTGDSLIRKVSVDGTITTFAGGVACCNIGDGGPAIEAWLGNPAGGWSLSFDGAGNLYLADGSSSIRAISPAGIITTIAGRAIMTGYSGDGGPSLDALLLGPSGVAADSAGHVYVADTFNNAIRVLQAGSTLSIIGVANAASAVFSSISPGEIVVVYGSGMGPAQLTSASVGSSGLYGTELAGTSVSFNGIPAPIIYTSTTQVAAVVPYASIPFCCGFLRVGVAYQGRTSGSLSVPNALWAPGVFTLDSTGKGQGAVVNQDGSINGATAPAKSGDIITLFATGEGQTYPAGVDGKPASSPLPRPSYPITVTIGGINATVQYAGGAPGEIAGLMQVNATIPSGIQTGNFVPVLVTIGNVSSQSGVTIAVH